MNGGRVKDFEPGEISGQGPIARWEVYWTSETMRVY